MSKISKIVFFFYSCLCKHHDSGPYIDKMKGLTLRHSDYYLSKYVAGW